MLTSTTGDSAYAPLGPICEDAVNRAWLCVAVTIFNCYFADAASKGRLGSYATSSALTASTTGLVTCGPFGPFAHHTIDGAGIGIAYLSFFCGFTYFAAEC